MTSELKNKEYLEGLSSDILRTEADLAIAVLEERFEDAVRLRDERRVLTDKYKRLAEPPVEDPTGYTVTGIAVAGVKEMLEQLGEIRQEMELLRQDFTEQLRHLRPDPAMGNKVTMPQISGGLSMGYICNIVSSPTLGRMRFTIEQGRKIAHTLGIIGDLEYSFWVPIWSKNEARIVNYSIKFNQMGVRVMWPHFERFLGLWQETKNSETAMTQTLLKVGKVGDSGYSYLTWDALKKGGYTMKDVPPGF